MPCVDLTDLLSAYADGQTLPAQTEMLEAHLASCEPCRRVVTRYGQTRGLLALAGDDTWTPPDLRLRITLACRSSEHERRKPAWLGAISAGVAAIAVAGAVFGSQALAPVLVATPAIQQQVSVTGTQVAAPPRTVVHPTSAAACPQHSISGIARCLGVSRAIVPTILLEEKDEHILNTGVDNNGTVTQLVPLNTASSTAGLKGGGARGLNNAGRRGMQAM